MKIKVTFLSYCFSIDFNGVEETIDATPPLRSFDKNTKFIEHRTFGTSVVTVTNGVFQFIIMRDGWFN